MARKMFREAIDVYTLGADSNAILSNKLGIAYHQMLQLDMARKYYVQAIRLNPKYAEAVNNLGTIYYARKQYRKSIGQYNKAIKLAPTRLPSTAISALRSSRARSIRKRRTPTRRPWYSIPKSSSIATPAAPSCRSAASRSAPSSTITWPRLTRRPATTSARCSISARPSRRASRTGISSTRSPSLLA